MSIDILIWVAAAVAAAFILLNIAQTMDAYPRLPASIPVHLDIRGRADTYGPKQTVWLLVALQILCAAIFVYAGYAVAAHIPGTHGTLRQLALIAPFIMALLWRAQNLLITLALSGKDQIAMGNFWLFFVATMGAVLITAFWR